MYLPQPSADTKVMKMDNAEGKREEDKPSDSSFMARYKSRRLDSGVIEVDLTDD